MQKTMNQIRKYAFVSGVLALMASQVEAAIIRVDNRPGRPTDFPDLGTAISKSQAGDTIYIAGSPDPYGVGKDIHVNKPLNLMGSGYFLKENFPRNRTEAFGATINNLIITEEGAGADIAGVYLKELTIEADDCLIHRCFLKWVRIGKDRNVARSRIHQCQFDWRRVGADLGSVLEYSGRDLLFSNNIMTFHAVNSIRVLRASTTATFSHNTIINWGTTLTHVSESELIFENNIIFQRNENILNDFKNAGYRISENNFLAHTDGVTNYSAPILDEIFLRADTATDARYQLGLSAENPARGAGIFGEDLGAFGGATPYVLSGIPPVPYFEIFEAQSTVGPTGTLKVRLKALGGE